MLDRADPVPLPDGPVRPSSVIRPEDPVLFVDQNVWLLRRELMLANPVPQECSAEDYATNKGVDDLFVERLVRAGVRPVSTGLPTVRYYLGGRSNGYRPDPAPVGRRAEPARSRPGSTRPAGRP